MVSHRNLLPNGIPIGSRFAIGTNLALASTMEKTGLRQWAKTLILILFELLLVGRAQGSLTRHEFRQVKEELVGLSTIRVAITKAPGLGHQAAGAAVVESLRQLGYEGQIEIVYDSIPTAKKLKHFWSFFGDEDIGQTNSFPKKGLRFRSFDSLANENAPILPLAFMGADDSFTMPPELHVQHLIK